MSVWLWVARERALGDNLVFYPYSSALGAVMAPADVSITDVGDLKGKKLGVAGGPLDKSWLLLRASALRSEWYRRTTDGPGSLAEIRAADPPI